MILCGLRNVQAAPLMVVGSWSLKVWRGRAAVEQLLDLTDAGELALGALPPQSAVPALRGSR